MLHCKTNYLIYLLEANWICILRKGDSRQYVSSNINYSPWYCINPTSTFSFICDMWSGSIAKILDELSNFVSYLHSRPEHNWKPFATTEEAARSYFITQCTLGLDVAISFWNRHKLRGRTKMSSSPVIEKPSSWDVHLRRAVTKSQTRRELIDEGFDS